MTNGQETRTPRSDPQCLGGVLRDLPGISGIFFSMASVAQKTLLIWEKPWENGDLYSNDVWLVVTGTMEF